MVVINSCISKKISDFCERDTNSNSDFFEIEALRSIGQGLTFVKARARKNSIEEDSYYSAIFNSNKELLAFDCDLDILFSSARDGILMECSNDKAKTKEYYHYRCDEFTNRLRLIEVLKSKNRPYIIESENATVCVCDDEKEKKQIYSLTHHDMISPKVDVIRPVRADNGVVVFEYRDKVTFDSNSQNQPVETTLVGFISPNGNMLDGVYDSYFGRFRECSLNGHPNFLQYGALKGFVKWELKNTAQRREEEEKSVKRRLKKFCEGTKLDN